MAKVVKCVDTDHYPITIGNFYEVIEERGSFFDVTNDIGAKGAYYKHRFTEAPDGKYVRCTDTEDSGGGLTRGKIYCVVREDQSNYYVIGDDKITFGYLKKRFTVIGGEEVSNKDKVHAVNETSRTYYFPTKYGLKEVTVNNVREVIISDSGNHRLKTSDGTLEIIPSGWVRVSIAGTEWAF